MLLNRGDQGADVIRIHPIIVVEEQDVVGVHEVTRGCEDATTKEHVVADVLWDGEVTEARSIESRQYGKNEVFVLLSIDDDPHFDIGMILAQSRIDRLG